MMISIQQGDIFVANLNPIQGHEQAGHRPVLVLQNNTLNKNLNTVIIAPITTNCKAKGYLTTYFLDKSTGMKQESVALLYQVRTIDKTRLGRHVASLTPDRMKAVKQQLLLVF